jgi:hypothetical protein
LSGRAVIARALHAAAPVNQRPQVVPCFDEPVATRFSPTATAQRRPASRAQAHSARRARWHQRAAGPREPGAGRGCVLSSSVDVWPIS